MEKEQPKKCFCARCFLPIDEEDKVDIGGQNFHRMCSTCCVCRQIPKEIKMFYGHVFCAECFKAHVLGQFRGETPAMHSCNWWSQWAPGNPCNPCMKHNMADNKNEKEGESCKSCSNEEPCKKCICSRCLQPVDEKEKVDIGGQHFHSQCARCCHACRGRSHHQYHGLLSKQTTSKQYPALEGETKDLPALEDGSNQNHDHNHNMQHCPAHLHGLKKFPGQEDGSQRCYNHTNNMKPCGAHIHGFMQCSGHEHNMNQYNQRVTHMNDANHLPATERGSHQCHGHDHGMRHCPAHTCGFNPCHAHAYAQELIGLESHFKQHNNYDHEAKQVPALEDKPEQYPTHDNSLLPFPALEGGSKQNLGYNRRVKPAPPLLSVSKQFTAQEPDSKHDFVFQPKNAFVGPKLPPLISKQYSTIESNSKQCAAFKLISKQ